jgi:heme A synthase
VELHAGGAVVTALVLGAASGLTLAWLRARKARDPWLAVPARAAGGLLLLQVALGVAALIRWQASIASHTPGTGLDIGIAASHTAVGSLLLAVSLALSLRHVRLRAGGRPPARRRRCSRH